jgi:hypothetical protein
MNLISVTRALSPFFDASAIPPAVLEFASTRGTQVHQACAAYAQSLPVRIDNGAYPYFESFRNWFDRYVKRALFVEAEFSDPHTYGIVGHPDLVAELTDGRIVVIDYKTPAAESLTWKSQIAGYIYLVRPVVGEVGGMALQLPRDGGTARAIHYKNTAEDFAAFIAALTAYRHFKGV